MGEGRGNERGGTRGIAEGGRGHPHPLGGGGGGEPREPVGAPPA